MNTPTEPGFYWLREKFRDEDVVVEVMLWKNKLKVYFPGYDQDYNVSEFDDGSEWGERLESPFGERENELQ